ncbi:hypothetical protein EV215_0017 [Hypnocyclicus thermotrophus]|uniref:TonB family protein n=1 Tax=Hypnocyclicus thermotrophus TaxID=1627895 RepID=A0AA46DZV7_9FUSO|nr:hypothetical protein [Hypnocyclicus thermotrophus]TDT72230.1 hypothetical protein EV215_0017 [Hypnocyclicus thermotrophus]
MKKYILFSIIFHFLLFYFINDWFLINKPIININNISVGIIEIIEPKKQDKSINIPKNNIITKHKVNFFKKNFKLENNEKKAIIKESLNSKNNIKKEKLTLLKQDLELKNLKKNLNNEKKDENNKKSIKSKREFESNKFNKQKILENNKNQISQIKKEKKMPLFQNQNLANNNISKNTSNKIENIMNTLSNKNIDFEKHKNNIKFNNKNMNDTKKNLNINNSSGNKKQIETIEYNKNINFKIIKYENPKYPKPAQILKLKKDVIVKATFIINEFGDVENIELKSDYKNYKKLGFYEEVEKVIKNYKFSPIFYNNKIVKVKFIKNYKFISPYKK